VSLLGLVCGITEISNPGLSKEGKTHKHGHIGARTVSRCTAPSLSSFHFDTVGGRECLSSVAKE